MPAPDFTAARESLNDEIADFIQQKTPGCNQGVTEAKPQKSHMTLIYPESKHNDHKCIASKADRYGWDTIENNPGKFEYIDKSKLAIDPSVQRDAENSISEKSVLKMASGWNWISCGALSVSLRAGKYVVFDGQHRLLAAMRREEIKTLPCLVFRNATVAEEAVGFLKINTSKRPVSVFDRHRIAIVANDPVALATERAARTAGITFSKSPGPGQTKALDWLQRNAGSEHVDTILRAAVDVMRDGPVSRRFLDALTYIHRFTIAGLDDRIVNIMRKHGHKLIESGMTRAASGFAKGGARVYAVGVLEVANFRLQQRIELVNEAVR